MGKKILKIILYILDGLVSFTLVFGGFTLYQIGFGSGAEPVCIGIKGMLLFTALYMCFYMVGLHMIDKHMELEI